MSHEIKYFISVIIKNSYVLTLSPILLLFAILSRFVNRRVGIGLGPEPLINNLYHKKALENYGFRAETFVTQTYFITSDFDKVYKFPLRGVYSYIRSLFVYECLYLYFNGNLLFKNTLLYKLDPLLLNIANVKTVIMPYGGDVQDLSRSKNLLFKNSMSEQYPMFRMQRKSVSKQIDMWQGTISYYLRM